MGTRPKLIRLSESSPGPDFDPYEEKKNGKKAARSSLIGGVIEKGFSISRSDKPSAIQSKVTPFPVARHRAEGPYWPPPSRVPENSTTGDNAEEDTGTALVDFAAPLSRSKDRANKVSSQWRSNRIASSGETSNCFSFASKSTNSSSRPTSTIDASRDFVAGERNPVQDELGRLGSAETPGIGTRSHKLKADITFVSEEDQNGRSPAGADREQFVDLTFGQSACQSIDGKGATGEDSVFAERSTDQLAMAGAEVSLVPGRESKRDFGSAQVDQNKPSLEMVDQEIDKETRNTVFSMSPAEVAEAQAELSEKFRPELLEMLRRRGLEKERKRSGETRAATSRIAEAVSERTKEEAFDNTRKISENSSEKEVCTTSVNGNIDKNLDYQASVVQAESITLSGSRSQSAAELETPPYGECSDPTEQPKAAPSDLWTLRVESIRSMRFDLEGNVLFFEPAVEESATVSTSSAEGAIVGNQENALSVVERDMLRTEGDPAGSGYTLKEALNLVRSTVPGQRAVALRLIAAVLDKAIQGLQMQQAKPVSFADLKGVVDWQAVWAYALGPEAELVLTLRLALDDGHSTVVAASARALQALLSYSGNESFFDSLESLWPGDKIVYTAPIFRRKTKHDEGFIGSGRWKYNVKRSEMFPFSGTAAQEQVEEEGTDTVGEDGHIANKDVAAGLVRMGLLPRLRYVLEVDQLIIADDALLCVLISLARHSPAAAAAVMSCPRLISTVLRRFILNQGVECQETWSCQLKAVRLLKVLSQASKSNCERFEKDGVLEALLRPLSQKLSEESLGSQESLRGFYSTTIETIRFWRVCLSYRIGLSFFTDCYPTLCVWLLPLSEDEIIRGGPDASFTLVIESHGLLENIARTLPVLHDNLSPTVSLAVQLDGTRWSWSVAMTMLNTALKWLSPDRIYAVHVLLKQFLQGKGEQVENGMALRTRTRKILGVLGSLLHFLATVCEKIMLEKELEKGLTGCNSSSLPWLPTFVPHLGLAIAGSGLLNVATDELQSNLSNGELEKTHMLLDLMCFCLSKRDNDSMLAALNCQHAFVRVSSIVDKLISINKPKGVSGPPDQPMAHALLDRGLILSAEDDLRRWVTIIGNIMTSRSSLIDMSSRGGPAPGVGIGWGSLRGGVFSKDVMVAQASARLNLELISVLSAGDEALESDMSRSVRRQGTLFDPLWRINTGLALAALATPPNADMVGRGCSKTIFNPACVSFLVENIEAGVVNRRSQDPEGFHSGPGYDMLKSAYLSKILDQHFESFWLATKPRKSPDSGESHALPGKANGSLNPKLPTVHEESSTEDGSITPTSLMEEFAGQRLPVPSHWFLSPLVTDIARATTTTPGTRIDELEVVVTAGIAFFLGLELAKANVSAIGPAMPLVRKIHTLSCVFVTGGDVFLRPLARNLIGALQDLLGRQPVGPYLGFQDGNRERIVASGIREGEREPAVHGNLSASSSEKATPVLAVEISKVQSLDFEKVIDPSYITYAETIAEQFVSSSYGDFVFGRQVAIYLWTSVPDIIRLATWRILADARVLDLLPPLSQCCGQPSRYLNPIETDQKMLEAYVSAWASGALDRAATKNSLPFRLALHHLGGFIFDKRDATEGEDLLIQKKHARTLVRSTLGRSDRQAMLIRLLVGDQTSGDVKEHVKTRLVFLGEACEGDAVLSAEIQRVPSLL